MKVTIMFVMFVLFYLLWGQEMTGRNGHTSEFLQLSQSKSIKKISSRYIETSRGRSACVFHFVQTYILKERQQKDSKAKQRSSAHNQAQSPESSFGKLRKISFMYSQNCGAQDAWNCCSHPKAAGRMLLKSELVSTMFIHYYLFHASFSSHIKIWKSNLQKTEKKIP